MIRWLTILLFVCVGTSAWATNTCNHLVVIPKNDSHVLINPGTPDGREGGETVDTAFPILSLPFSDTGNTCDNIHDYDEACPYMGSDSKDVVYSFTPGTDLSIDVDLCGSSYDTKTSSFVVKA